MAKDSKDTREPTGPRLAEVPQEPTGPPEPTDRDRVEAFAADVKKFNESGARITLIIDENRKEGCTLEARMDGLMSRGALRANSAYFTDSGVLVVFGDRGHIQFMLVPKAQVSDDKPPADNR